MRKQVIDTDEQLFHLLFIRAHDLVALHHGAVVLDQLTVGHLGFEQDIFNRGVKLAHQLPDFDFFSQISRFGTVVAQGIFKAQATHKARSTLFKLIAVGLAVLIVAFQPFDISFKE